MDAAVEELLQIFAFCRGFLHEVKSVFLFTQLLTSQILRPIKMKWLKKPDCFATVSNWREGFWRDDKWREQRQDVHKRNTICRLLTVVSRTDGSSYCEGNATLMYSRALFWRPLFELLSSPSSSAGVWSRRCQQREQAAQRSGAGSDSRALPSLLCCPACCTLG